ncbi:MAG: hypothetical protein E7390_08020 [Ruminococcaceae bacterium]|nr:hypothetical protein [Oscillospiraceae bacterium]
MKKLSTILAVLLVLTMLPAVGTSAAGQNLIQNGDFELVGEDGFATGWERSNSAIVSVKAVTDASGNTNNKVVAFVKPADSENIKFRTDLETSPVDPTKAYVLSFDAYRTAGASRFNINIFYRDDEGDKIKDELNTDLYFAEQSVQPTNKDAWQHFEFDVTNLPETTRIFEIVFQTYQNVSGSENAAELYLDNITIDEKEADSDDAEDTTESTKDLIQNGDFELVDETTGFATGWTPNAYNAYISIQNFAGADGVESNVVAFVNPAKSQNITFSTSSDVSPLASGTDYLLTFDGFKTGGKTKFNVVIYFRNEEGDKILNEGEEWTKSFASQDASPKNAWKHFALIIPSTEMPPDAASMDIRFQNSQDATAAANNGTLYLDNISLVPAESKVTYTNGEGDAAGTIAVSYDAYLQSSYTGDAPSIVAIAALYKAEGTAKSFVDVIISAPVPLEKGAYKTIDVGSFDMPEVDVDKYSIRVFSYKSVASLEKFDAFPAEALGTPAA